MSLQYQEHCHKSLSTSFIFSSHHTAHYGKISIICHWHDTLWFACWEFANRFSRNFERELKAPEHAAHAATRSRIKKSEMPKYIRPWANDPLANKSCHESRECTNARKVLCKPCLWDAWTGSYLVFLVLYSALRHCPHRNSYWMSCNQLHRRKGNRL